MTIRTLFAKLLELDVKLIMYGAFILLIITSSPFIYQLGQNFGSDIFYWINK